MFLAILATVTFVCSAIFMFDVEKREIFEFFVVSVFGLGVIIIGALLVTGIKYLIKRWLAA